MVSPVRLIKRKLTRRGLGGPTVEALYRAIPKQYKDAELGAMAMYVTSVDLYVKTKVVMSYNDSRLNRKQIEEWFEQAILLSGHPETSPGVKAAQQ